MEKGVSTPRRRRQDAIQAQERFFERKKGRVRTYKTPFPGSAGEEALNRASEVSGG